ncbi:dienelactone hydrolase family protein [Planctomicrobium sp. SH661]|uniref:dienelactone hydrolase family protein n=1 Tax=Planctomicrobium sp. SH661 TaxID=3448124 RepID=UPI003F5C6C83
MQHTNRRTFLTSMATSSVVASALPSLAADPENSNAPGERMAIREQLLNCLGGEWPEPCELQSRTLKTEQKEGYRLEWVDYLTEPEDRVPAILLIPDGVTAESPAPGICVWHQHAGQWHLGKSEPAGLAGDPMHHTGVALARLGYVVLCPDALCFEERQDPTGKLKDGNFERFEFLRYVVAGKCMAWKNILDMRRAVDFISARPEVRSDKLGCYGHSMGSTHAWMVGTWEPRLKCVVGNCCLPTYEGIHREKLLHCFPNFVPGFFEYGDTPEIAALTAPRALHLNLGGKDAGSPLPEAEAGLKRIAAAYDRENASGNFSSFIQPEAGHVLSPEMWEQVQNVFARHLKS